MKKKKKKKKKKRKKQSAAPKENAELANRRIKRDK